MNLIDSPWLPILRRSGKQERIAPWQIAETGDPVIALAAPRHDDRGGLFQFLLALLQTTVAPECEHGPKEWGDWLESPPSPLTLRERFAIYADAFELFDERQPFMQDVSIFAEDSIPRDIDDLLIDNNETHFNKPGRIQGMCASCAATALFTLQTNAPEGGRGHYTSIRGGGPLTTLVVFDPQANQQESTLWRNLWLNVLEPKVFERHNTTPRSDEAAIFPWLEPKRFVKAHRKQDVFPLDIHPLHMLWAMPRRIVLQRESGLAECCGICGAAPAEVRRYHTRPNGISYSNEPIWEHPWSPHYLVDKKGLAPRHPQPGGFNYRHWPEMIGGNETHFPARVVSHFADHRLWKERSEQLRVWAFGYDMKSNKARCWYEATLPLYALPETIRSDFGKRTNAMADTASEAAGYLRSCVKEAWFRPGETNKGDTGFLVRSFFEHTERRFFALLEQIKNRLLGGEEDMSLLQQWHTELVKSAFILFDAQAAITGFEYSQPRRIAQAHEKLKNLLYGKDMRQLLQLPAKSKSKDKPKEE